LSFGHCSAADIRLRRVTLAIGQVPDGAGGVVEQGPLAAQPAPRRSLVGLKRRVESHIRSGVEDQIAEVVMPVRPGRAVIVENPGQRVRRRIGRHVVQTQITVHESEVIDLDNQAKVAIKRGPDARQEFTVADHLGQVLV
jgi:hypothetical protein